MVSRPRELTGKRAIRGCDLLDFEWSINGNLGPSAPRDRTQFLLILQHRDALVNLDGSYFFTTANQFVITVIGELLASLLTPRMRNRWPSLATA